MARYQRRCPTECVRQASGGSIGIGTYGTGPVFDGNTYPVMVGEVPMRPPAASKTRQKPVPGIPQRCSTRATLRRQQQMQRESQRQPTAQLLQSHPQSQRQSQSHSHSQSQPEPQPHLSTLQEQVKQLQLQLQQQQLQLQHEQMRQLYGGWPLGGIAQANANALGNNMNIFNPLAPSFNLGPTLPSNCSDFWPGYTMVTPGDPSRPYSFGLSPTD
ncbi:centrosomal and chromosomal factor [Drosophila virilis]|uniref:Uncharacterized protein n=1 Tax=Drosophila virilis TaxID=7244 RepID=B4LSP7_DROVI|nr:uncharacterized protein LOC6627709 [Drosophila virilis]EDW63786.1 uncharacterized protein Dvir_GJ11178 [Drosophila virilis]